MVKLFDKHKFLCRTLVHGKVFSFLKMVTLFDKDKLEITYITIHVHVIVVTKIPNLSLRIIFFNKIESLSQYIGL